MEQFKISVSQLKKEAAVSFAFEDPDEIPLCFKEVDFRGDILAWCQDGKNYFALGRRGGKKELLKASKKNGQLVHRVEVESREEELFQLWTSSSLIFIRQGPRLEVLEKLDLSRVSLSQIPNSEGFLVGKSLFFPTWAGRDELASFVLQLKLKRFSAPLLGEPRRDLDGGSYLRTCGLRMNNTPVRPEFTVGKHHALASKGDLLWSFSFGETPLAYRSKREEKQYTFLAEAFDSAGVSVCFGQGEPTHPDASDMLRLAEIKVDKEESFRLVNKWGRIVATSRTNPFLAFELEVGPAARRYE